MYTQVSFNRLFGLFQVISSYFTGYSQEITILAPELMCVGSLFISKHPDWLIPVNTSDHSLVDGEIQTEKCHDGRRGDPNKNCYSRSTLGCNKIGAPPYRATSELSE